MQAQASSGLTCLWCLEYSDYFEVNHFKFCLQKGILPPVCNLLLELSLLAWFYHFALSCPKWSVSCSVVSDSCDPMDCSLPGSSVHGILQARIQEWVAISSSRGLNLGLLHCKQMSLYRLSHQGSPSCLDVVFFFFPCSGFPGPFKSVDLSFFKVLGKVFSHFP